ncbi:hypothetical protein RYX36_006505 [Vicia faba]
MKEQAHYAKQYLYEYIGTNHHFDLAIKNGVIVVALMVGWIEQEAYVNFMGPLKTGFRGNHCDITRRRLLAIYLAKHSFAKDLLRSVNS